MIGSISVPFFSAIVPMLYDCIGRKTDTEALCFSMMALVESLHP